ncbi:STAS domain-containing protein [Saliterribacillus persicus]|uniref:Anti-sigma B factor antagonist/stage II sporulation protein AA (Anti-sigma F factor antagonist) n=1 Tax=Saliterribacillus persicus TaxID=930114 RepID=A0A368XXM1_9BACI|nr:STAS domain-containing protein [Saliterribacillus persicus]RCW71886.1 anti-sigma B factor antagonist/stage II sporulation protein AA (anti-sigma F factor antagonist) [Saliterribacillus persicus]
MLEFEKIKTQRLLFVKCKGDLDIECEEIVHEELIPAMIHEKNVRVDFSNVHFVDSSGMGLLISLVKTLKDKDINITIQNINDDILEVFDLLQIPQIIGSDVLLLES